MKQRCRDVLRIPVCLFVSTCLSVSLRVPGCFPLYKCGSLCVSPCLLTAYLFVFLCVSACLRLSHGVFMCLFSNCISLCLSVSFRLRLCVSLCIFKLSAFLSGWRKEQPAPSAYPPIWLKSSSLGSLVLYCTKCWRFTI